MVDRMRLAWIFLPAVLFAQSQPGFEVASVKPFIPEPGAGRSSASGCTPLRIDRSRVDICGSLAHLIGYAYAVPADRVEGPEFVRDRRLLFQIQAKLPEGVSPEQAPEMMQALLADRFKLATHRSTRQQEMTAMIIAKGGLKMKPAASVDEIGGVQRTDGAGHTVRWQSSAITMGELAHLCDGVNFVPPVVDMTGVKGRFQLDMTVDLKETFEAAAVTAIAIPPCMRR
jgi:uncharacterized protein (TIGR03435 family)